MAGFEFVRANQAEYPVATMCRVLGVSTSGYYAWLEGSKSKRAKQDEALMAKIRRIYQASKGTYGAPRIHAELQAQGERVGRKRVARLMRQAGLQGVSRRRGKGGKKGRGGEEGVAPDLLKRRFEADRPNKVWVADITHIPTGAGFLYLAVVVDVYSRRVVGWAMATHLRTELVIEALNMAVERRGGGGVIHHSDRGSQYTSLAFGERCKEVGIRVSMGSVGDCYDNALCESFFATLECELLGRMRFANPREARMRVFEYIEGWYNPHRRHSALGYLSPVEYEERHTRRET